MLSALIAVLIASVSPPATKAGIELCEAIDSDGTSYAKPIAPTAGFRPKAEGPNVHAIATLTDSAGSKALKFIVVDAGGATVAEQESAPKAGWATAKFAVNIPGSYVLRVTEKESAATLGESEFKVLADADGPFSNGAQPTGQGSLWICREVDDDWKPVGSLTSASSNNRLFSWKAGEGFNLLIKNKPKTPFGTLFLGIIIHQQGEDGRDVGFVTEFQSEQLEEDVATMWCTVQPPTSLPAGRYTVYVIDWYTRESLEHNGNLKQYYAKVTLVVKDNLVW